MTLSVLFCNKYSNAFSGFCLSLALSTLLSIPLVASQDLTEDTEKKGIRGLKRLRENDLNHKEESASKIQKIDESKDLHPDLIRHIFLPLSFPSVATGQIVSKSWNSVLCDDLFCNLWADRFSPSTPEALGMTPSKFIRYWATPSFTILTPTKFENITINAMSADGSTLVGEGNDPADWSRYKGIQWNSKGWKALPILNGDANTRAWGANHNGSIMVGSTAYGVNNNRETAVRCTNGVVVALPLLNDGTAAEARALNYDGSIIVGRGNDGANNNKPFAVRWVEDKIEALPILNKDKHYSANVISGDGSTIVGTEKNDAEDDRSTLVRWTKEDVTALPFLNAHDKAFCNAINHDGSVMGGEEADMRNFSYTKPVLWQNDKISALPLLTEDLKHAWVRDMDATGFTLCGETATTLEAGKTAVVWQGGKVSSLKALLEESHPLVKKALEGATLIRASAISANGLQVAGKAFLNGESVIFKAILPSAHS